MGCNATFAIAANEKNMIKVAHAIANEIIKDDRNQKSLLAKDLRTEAEGRRPGPMDQIRPAATTTIKLRNNSPAA